MLPPLDASAPSSSRTHRALGAKAGLARYELLLCGTLLCFALGHVLFAYATPSSFSGLGASLTVFNGFNLLGAAPASWAFSAHSAQLLVLAGLLGSAMVLLGLVAFSRKAWVSKTALLLFMVLLGWLHANGRLQPVYAAQQQSLRAYAGQWVQVQGQVVAHERAWQLEAKQINQQALPQPVRLRFKWHPPAPEQAQGEASLPKGLLGQQVAVKGRLRLPNSAPQAGRFDEQAYLRGLGVAASLSQAKLLSSTPAPFTPVSPWWQFRAWLEAFRAQLAHLFEDTLGRDQGALLGGIVLGERAVEVPKPIKQAFVQTGLIHLLAASGLNVGIVAGVLLLLAGVLRLPRSVRFVVAMLGVAAYCLLSGLPPSIQRAGLMLELALTLKLLNTQLSPLVLLFIALAVLLVLAAHSVYSLGLQLSVLTTFGIIAFTSPGLAWLQNRLNLHLPQPDIQPLPSKGLPSLSRRSWVSAGFSWEAVQGAVQQLWATYFKPKRLAKRLALLMLSAAVLTTAAQLWASPLLAFYFNKLPLHSIALNVLASLLVPLCTALGFTAAGLALVWPPLAKPLLVLTAPFNAGLLALAGLGSQQSWALWALPSPSPWVLACAYALLLLWAVGVHPKIQWSVHTLRQVSLSLLALALLPSILLNHLPQAQAQQALTHWAHTQQAQAGLLPVQEPQAQQPQVQHGVAQHGVAPQRFRFQVLPVQHPYSLLVIYPPTPSPGLEGQPWVFNPKPLSGWLQWQAAQALRHEGITHLAAWVEPVATRRRHSTAGKLLAETFKTEGLHLERFMALHPGQSLTLAQSSPLPGLAQPPVLVFSSPSAGRFQLSLQAAQPQEEASPASAFFLLTGAQHLKALPSAPAHGRWLAGRWLPQHPSLQALQAGQPFSVFEAKPAGFE